MKKTKRRYFFVLAIGLLFLAGICSICLSISMDKTEYNADIVNNSENFLIKGSFLGVSLMECFYTELSETATEYVAVSDNVQNEEGYLLLGSRKVVWPWYGKYLSFYQLNQDGNEECETFFMVRDFNEEESLCVVMIP